jgi:light-regulated signal transduction histidine kinase (bacteriophytochrome)
MFHLLYERAADAVWLFDPSTATVWTATKRGHNVAKRPGTGLGLVVVKRCVDLHGGKLKVHYKLGEGTALTVRLPP